MRELVRGMEGIVEAKVAENGRNKMVMGSRVARRS